MTKKLDLAGNEWTFELLREIDEQVHDIAANQFKLDTYPNQIEVISAEQMLDAYSSSAMPVMYPHWSYGKSFSINEHLYETGQQNLAYEVVINSNPCISYLMEENTMTMQTLVIAHACYGHNSFFKGNYLFRQWTQADSIIDYLVFAKKYVIACEEKYGAEAVEEVLDAAHALQYFGVDRYKRRYETEASLKVKRDDFAEEKRRQYDEIMAKVSPVEAAKIERSQDNYPREPVENILYFIEKEAPKLLDWERELVRIVRKMSQYFYPQGQTKVMNEGWASFWHYTLLNTLYDEKLVSDGFMLEFLTSHTNVVFQPDSRDGRYRALNPYALGFAIFSDIRRLCEKPTAEDKQWFPELAGSGNWMKAIDFAMRHFKDESFIRQFLSPKVIRDFRLFAIADHKSENELFIDSIHNDEGYRRIRTLLANQYSRESMVPDIQVGSFARMTDRSLTLTHMSRRGRPLNEDEAEKTLAQVERLWGFPVHLETSNVIETRIEQQSKLDLSGSVAPFELPLSDMPAHVWASPDLLRSRFHLEAVRYFECESVLAVTGIESGISALARLFQTWYGSMRVVLAEPSFDQWDKRFRRANHVVLDWPVDFILQGDIPDCDVVVLGRPVNPTCQMIDIQQIKPLARRLREQGGWLILDEAYLDWTGEESYASFIAAEPAIVLRSVAPFSGLAGANLAFVCGPKSVCTALLNEVGTQAVSSPQWWLALKYFEAEQWRQAQLARLEDACVRLECLWRKKLNSEVEIYKGGYFISFEHSESEAWAVKLEELGVLVRTYSSETSILRCSVPRAEIEWQRLGDAIDMLGV